MTDGITDERCASCVHLLFFVEFDQSLSAQITAAPVDQGLTVGKRLLQNIQIQPGVFCFLFRKAHIFHKVLHEEAGGKVTCQDLLALKVQLLAAGGSGGYGAQQSIPV